MRKNRPQDCHSEMFCADSYQRNVLYIIIQACKCQQLFSTCMCQVIVGTFSSFFDISLFLLFSDNLARTLSDHFMFLFNRMLLQGLSSMLSALRPIAAYDA